MRRNGSSWPKHRCKAGEQRPARTKKARRQQDRERERARAPGKSSAQRNSVPVAIPRRSFCGGLMAARSSARSHRMPPRTAPNWFVTNRRVAALTSVAVAAQRFVAGPRGRYVAHPRNDLVVVGERGPVQRPAHVVQLAARSACAFQASDPSGWRVGTSCLTERLAQR